LNEKAGEEKLMKISAEHVEERLKLLGGLMYSAKGIGAWCFDKNQHLFYSTYPYSKDLVKSPYTKEILRDIIEDPQTMSEPGIWTDELNLVWIAEKAVQDVEGTYMVIVVGPFLFQKQLKEHLIKKLTSLHLSLSTSMHYSRIFESMPVVSHDFARAIFHMLHYIIYDEFLPKNAIHFKELKNPKQTKEEGQVKENADDKLQLHINDFAGMEELEKRLLDNIREGTRPKKEGEKRVFTNDSIQEFLLPDELRTLKDNMIIFLDHCTSAAVEGGVPLQTAKEIESREIHKLELAHTINHAANANWNAYLAFIDAVRHEQSIQNQGISKPVRETMNFIRANFQEEITLADMAKRMHYTEYYLSRKFSKETGMKIQDYLKHVRIEMSKVMLVTSHKSIDQIAEEVCFKSRSHFDHTFKKLEGMTPIQYRNNPRASKI
jgi:YesN/AraC family two-component response regulator